MANIMTANHILTKNSKLQIIKESFYDKSIIYMNTERFMNAAPNTSPNRIYINNLISKTLTQNKREALQESLSRFSWNSLYHIIF